MPNKKKISIKPPEIDSPSLSPPPPPPPSPPPPSQMENEEEPPSQNYLQPPRDPPTLRKPPQKTKKKPLSKKKLAIIEQKLSLLSQNLRPRPFFPNLQTLESHEPLFSSLNLWNFLNIRLDSEIRTDLLSELIAHYDPIKHSSFVGGLRISLSRADLSRALSLPSSRTNQKSTSELDFEQFGGAEEVSSVLSGFIANWMVFLDDEAAILPEEVVAANKMVKEGKPNRVDWAGLMWALVEKEILGAPESGSCYYASHLQCLMKFQKPRLFEETELEGEAEVERSEAATMEEDVEVEEGGDVGSEKCGPGLSLGIAEDGEESKKVEEEEHHPILDGKDAGEEHCEELSKEEHCLREGGLNCTLGASNKEEQNEGEKTEVDKLCKEEEDEGKKVDNVFDDVLATAKFPTLERITSSEFMQVMDTNNSLSFGLDQSNGEFLGLGSDMHGKSMELDMGNSSGSFLFGNESKRPADEIDDQDNGYHQSHQQKRPRNDQPWEQTPTVAGFDGCIEQLHLVMGRARMDLAEKEQACINVQAQAQYLSGVVQRKDVLIQSLEKTTMEEMQRRQIEANRFNHDLRTLSSVLFGCKRALKDTQIAFAEYRKKFPLDSEQPRECSKEDADDLCDKGLEKPCTEKEKEMRQCAWKLINDENRSWCDKLHKYSTSVSALATRLVGVSEQLKLLKGRMAEARDHRV